MRLSCFRIAIVLVGSLFVGCGGRDAGEVRAPAEQVSIEPAVATDDNAIVTTDDSPAATDNSPAVEDPPTAVVTPAAQQYRALLTEYEEEGGARTFAERFLQLAEQNPEDPVAAEALLWVVSKVRGKPVTTRALELLLNHHIESDRLGLAGKDIVGSRSLAAGKLLRAAIEQNPHEHVRAHAAFHLASLLNLEANLVEQLKDQPELAPRVLQYYGKDYGAHLASLELRTLEQQRERLYEQMRDTFSHVEVDGVRLGALAEKMLFRIRHLSIGKVAPEIAGQDIAGSQFKLTDYRGKVVMLTFWGHW